MAHDAPYWLSLLVHHFWLTFWSQNVIVCCNPLMLCRTPEAPKYFFFVLHQNRRTFRATNLWCNPHPATPWRHHHFMTVPMGVGGVGGRPDIRRVGEHERRTVTNLRKQPPSRSISYAFLGGNLCTARYF